MRNAHLYELFLGWEFQTTRFKRKWSHNVGKPIYMQYPYCPEYWEKCKEDPNKKAIMLVGKMPGRWWPNNGVMEGMVFSQIFSIEEWKKENPFFQFMKEMEAIINSINDQPRLYLYWTNMFRFASEDFDFNKQNIVPNNNIFDDYLQNIKTLQDEIYIIDPEVLIFLTGPDYDKYINEIFPCTIKQIQGYNERSLVQVISSSLPERTFRTYHPDYLKRSKQMTSMINSIKNLL